MNALLVECHRKLGSEGVRTLFAFDNADKLPRKELQAYCSFCRELPSESALVMLFSGSSALTQVFKVGSNLEQEVWWHQIQLKPLSQAEVLPYLEQALSQAGYSEKLELTENQIQQMADLGKGLPGRINKIFPSVVLEPGLLKIKAKSKVSGTPVWIMLGLAGLLIVSFLFVSYQHGLFERVMPVFSLDELSSVDDESAVSSKEIDERDSKQKARLAMLDGVLKEKGINLPKVEQKPVLEKKEHVSESILGELVVLGEELVAEPESEVAVAAVESGIDESLSINTPTTSEAPSSDRILTSTQVNGNPDVYGNKTLGVSQEISEPKLNNDLDLKKKDEVKQIPVEKVANESIHFRSKAWLQGYSNNSYMAQILGSYSEETALNFIDQVGKQKFEVFYLVNEHKGKPWYVVFYGIFPAKTHAQDAVKNAPKIIRSQNPWIRRSSEVLASYPK